MLNADLYRDMMETDEMVDVDEQVTKAKPDSLVQSHSSPTWMNSTDGPFLCSSKNSDLMKNKRI